MLNSPASWYRNLKDRRQHGYWDGEAWDEPDDETPLAILRLTGRSDRPNRVLVTYKMSNQRRALQAVERLRRAGHDGAEIENRRAGDIEVFLDVTVADAARDEVARLVLDVDPESSLIT